MIPAIEQIGDRLLGFIDGWVLCVPSALVAKFTTWLAHTQNSYRTVPTIQVLCKGEHSHIFISLFFFNNNIIFTFPARKW